MSLLRLTLSTVLINVSFAAFILNIQYILQSHRVPIKVYTDVV